MGPVTTRLRVYPNDLDIFMHVNNGVYFTYADLGRIDLLLRADAFHLIRKRGWYPVIANETMQFKRSLLLGQRFSISTRLLGWSDTAIYIEQVFTRGDQLIAKGLIDCRFLKRTGGRVKHEEMRELLGIDEPSPEFPEHLVSWISSCKASKDAATV